jgi:PAS domain S-box-containing protein
MTENMEAALPTPLPTGTPAFSIGLSSPDTDPLTQSEGRFRALAQATGQIYWIADAHGQLTDTSSWCTFTGQTTDEARGDGWGAALHPDDREPTLTSWNTAIATRHPYRHEHRVRRADGQYRLMLIQAYPVLDAEGAVREWVGVDTDITLLQELQADVQASQEEFRATFEQAAVGIAHVRLDGQILRANQKFGEILGYAPEELLGHTFQELTYLPDLGTNLALFEQLLAGEIPTYTLEKRYIRKDGSLVWATLTGSLKRDRAGAPEYGIAVIEDISARKAAEEALRQSEQQYRQLFEAMAQGVIYSSTSGEILAANPAALRIVGLTKEEIQTRTVFDPRWQAIYEDGSPRPPETRPIARALRTGQPISDVVGFFNGKEQAYRWLQVTAIPEFRPGEHAPHRVFATFEDITERRRLEGELRARAQELETIFASMSEGLIVIGADGKILRANPAYEALVGWPPDSDFYTMPPEERYQVLQIRTGQGQLIPPDQMPIAQVFQGEQVTMDQVFRSGDGRAVHVSVRGAPLTDTTGRISGAVLVFHDITERQRLEEEVRTRAQELETIFASINEGLIVFGADGKILRTNPAYVALAGWPAGSALYTMTLEERVRTLAIRDEQGQSIPLDRFSTSRLLRGENVAEEQIFRRQDGRDVYVHLRGAPLTDAGGRLIGAVVVLHDDTERRQLEQQTHAALQALLRMAEVLVQQPLESDEQHSPLAGQHLAELAGSLLGCSVATIITLDPKTLEMQVLATVGNSSAQDEILYTMISSWSPTASDLAHLERLMAGETLVLDVTETPYQEQAALFGARQALVAPMRLGGQLMGMVVFNPGQSTRTFTEQQIALASATAQLVGLVVERERLFRQREEARASALAERETTRQMSVFLSLIGHELRTPLTSLKGQVQLTQRQLARLLSAQGELPGAVADSLPTRLAPVEEMLQRLRLPLWQLERLISDLVGAAQLQRGQFTLTMRPCDLALVVKEAVEAQRTVWPERVLDLRLPEGEGVEVHADAERVGQVVTNYLTNALKYTPPHSPIAVILSIEADQARLEVCDHGPGIPLQEQTQIWEQFRRGQGADAQSGTAGGLGLGLYLCKQLIERQGGQVGLESQVGTGSTFWFHLPLAVALR